MHLGLILTGPLCPIKKMMKYIDKVHGLTLVMCVCGMEETGTRSGYCVTQRLVPTHTGGWCHCSFVLQLILFLEDVYKG